MSLSSAVASLPGLVALGTVLWRKKAAEEPGALVSCGSTPVHCECSQSGLSLAFGGGLACGCVIAAFVWWRGGRTASQAAWVYERLPANPRSAISFD